MLPTRSVSRLVSLALALAACSPPPPPPNDALPDATTGADAIDTAPPIDVVAVDRPTIPRCGPNAVPWPTDAGPCAQLVVPPDAAVAPGQCTPTVNAPSATLATNALDGTAIVTPSGRRIGRAANRLALNGFPMSMLRIPGTSWVVVSDGGIHSMEHLRVIDLSTTPPSIVPHGDVAFARDGTAREPALFYGLAYDAAAHLLYASGGGGNRIYAYDVSSAGALTANPGRTIDLGVMEGTTARNPDGSPASAYIAGLALSHDATLLCAVLQRGHAMGIYSAADGHLQHMVQFANNGDLSPFPYVVVSRPADDRHVYVSLWGAQQIAEVDLALGQVTRTFAVGKNPEGILFSPDGARLYVAAADSDAVQSIDLSLPSAPVATAYLGGSMAALRGVSPSALAWGPGNRLYVAEADTNSISVLDGTTLAHVGRIATEWYPTDVSVDPDGSVTVITGKGLGTGVVPTTQDVDDVINGSIARYAPVDDTTLAANDTAVRQNNTVMRQFNDVSCPTGAPFDFPIPSASGTAPSTRIHHVILVVRENKTYDGLLGDYAGTPGNPANGDPSLTEVPGDQVPLVFPNIHALAQQYGNLDNYYSNAEQSIQGHVRTTEGRSTDYVERSWHTSWGRGTREPPNQGIAPVGIAEEGTILHALASAHVHGENWGDPIGDFTPDQFAGNRYPGVYYSLMTPDITKARALGDWTHGTNSASTNPARMCALAPFTYFLLPNDHTEGAVPGHPTPRSYWQDNDEATGFLVDAISHSTFWPDTLIIVIEDDPSDGGDHVDYHRSIAVLASPWVRHGYTSHVHYDESSLHRTIELILGVPPHNDAVANAAPLYDPFTSTPDYTPYSYIPRRECETRNPQGGMYAQESMHMDFTVPDNAPGLARMLWRMHHNGHEPPWRAITVPFGDADGDGR